MSKKKNLPKTEIAPDANGNAKEIETLKKQIGGLKGTITAKTKEVEKLKAEVAKLRTQGSEDVEYINSLVARNDNLIKSIKHFNALPWYVRIFRGAIIM